MSSNTLVPSAPGDAMRKCSFCSEQILADAKKCKHSGEFVRQPISRPVAAIFAGGVIVACLLAGMSPSPAQGTLAVGVWAIFALMFARVCGRG